jgi:hypothetical protein
VIDRIDFNFQVLGTTIRVVYNGITQLESGCNGQDDVYLSWIEPTWIEPNGVAAAMRAAGDLSRDDARKHALLLDPNSAWSTAVSTS